MPRATTLILGAITFCSNRDLVITWYHHDRKEIARLRISNLMKLTVERRVSITLDNSVYEVLRKAAEIRWPGFGRSPSAPNFLES
jgi:hypothetical protein